MSIAVKQQTFEGPLDLLLQLIESEKLDITTISLAAVTDEYLAYVEQLEQRRLPEIAEWLVIAARLLVLKSRALLPQADAETEEPADDLAAQLAEYKLFKELAAVLDTGLRSMPISISRSPSALALPPQLVTDGVELGLLQQSFSSLLEQLPDDKPAQGPDVEPTVSLEERISYVRSQLGNGPQAFERLFATVRSRLTLIVTFLAILELFKQGLIGVVANQAKLTLQLRSNQELI